MNARELSLAGERALETAVPGRWIQPASDDTINLARGYPYPEAIGVDRWREALGALLNREFEAPFQYSGSEAVEGLSHWLRQRSRMMGVMADGDDVLVTQGAIQALDLAVRCLVGRDEVVVVQGPTYMEALEVLSNYTHHILPVPTADNGLDFEALTDVLGRVPVRLLYLGASFQNPTGLVLEAEDRERLVALSQQFGFWIVEDGAYDALSFGEPIPPIKSYRGASTTVYLGSLSKTLAPGLRVGWAVGPSRLLTAMDRLKKDLAHPLSQAMVMSYFTLYDYDRHLKGLRDVYRERAEIALFCLSRGMPRSVRWSEPRGGYFIWLRYPESIDSGELLRDARSAGVNYLPGHFFFPNLEDPHALRVSYSYETTERLQSGIVRLGEVLAHHIPEGPI